MGKYKYYQQFKGKPSYRGKRNGPYLYFTGSAWLIGPSLGGNVGGIRNQYAGKLCPHLIHKAQWTYFYNNVWIFDPTMSVRCAGKQM